MSILYRHIFYSQEHISDTPGLQQGRKLQLKKAFLLPNNSLKTLHLRHNTLLWEMVTDIDINKSAN